MTYLAKGKMEISTKSFYGAEILKECFEFTGNQINFSKVQETTWDGQKQIYNPIISFEIPNNSAYSQFSFFLSSFQQIMEHLENWKKQILVYNRWSIVFNFQETNSSYLHTQQIEHEPNKSFQEIIYVEKELYQ